MNQHIPPRYLRKGDIVCDAILTALRSGKDIASAARLIGISRSTVRLWRKADPEFDRAVLLARQDGVAKVIADRLRGA